MIKEVWIEPRAVERSTVALRARYAADRRGRGLTAAIEYLEKLGMTRVAGPEGALARQPWTPCPRSRTSSSTVTRQRTARAVVASASASYTRTTSRRCWPRRVSPVRDGTPLCAAADAVSRDGRDHASELFGVHLAGRDRNARAGGGRPAHCALTRRRWISSPATRFSRRDSVRLRR